jgi:hypothetical protein
MQNKIEQIEGSVAGDEVAVDDASVPQVVQDLVSGG